MTHVLLAIIYVAFISLGLPDALLGAAWPSMYRDFSVPVSYSGIIFMIIAGGTIVSSLQSDRLTKRLGAGAVTAISVLTTALALFGYASRHMSWLHCMWGVGASLGPYIMGYALTGGLSWNSGYRYIAVLQIGLTAVLFFSLPLWRGQTKIARKTGAADTKAEPITLRHVVSIPGAKEIMITFFCYCAVEQTANLWASSYLVLHQEVSAETAAGFASLFFVGITAGRSLSGFLTLLLNDTQMIRLGQGVIAVGIITLLLPFGTITSLVGLLLIGLGCAPVYPSIIHATPANFGEDKSQAMIGVQMASAYAGTCLMPPVFGLVANHLGISLLPFYLMLILIVMVFMHERMFFKIQQPNKI